MNRGALARIMKNYAYRCFDIAEYRSTNRQDIVRLCLNDHSFEILWNLIYKQLKLGKTCIRTTYAEYMVEIVSRYIATERMLYEIVWLSHLILLRIPRDVRNLIIRQIVCDWPDVRQDVEIPTFSVEWKKVSFCRKKGYRSNSMWTIRGLRKAWIEGYRYNMICVRVSELKPPPPPLRGGGNE